MSRTSVIFSAAIMRGWLLMSYEVIMLKSDF